MRSRHDPFGRSGFFSISGCVSYLSLFIEPQGRKGDISFSWSKRPLTRKKSHLALRAKVDTLEELQQLLPQDEVF
jgi:hypothetical protein